MLDPASLERACTGARQLLVTANSFLGAGATSPERVDAPGYRNVFAAAERAGVEHIVFVSALLPEKYRTVDYIRVKFEAADALRRGRVAWTVLQPTAFMETWATIVGDPLLKNGRAQILGPGVRPFNLVAVDDVAAMIALVLDRTEARGADVPVGGPQNLTQFAIADTIARVTGRAVRYSHVPMAMLRAAAVLAPAFNPVFARQAKLGVLMNTEDNTFDMRPLLVQYPIPQTTLEEWARRRYASSLQPPAPRPAT
jgi:NADH dehydrogenase